MRYDPLASPGSPPVAKPPKVHKIPSATLCPVNPPQVKKPKAKNPFPDALLASLIPGTDFKTIEEARAALADYYRQHPETRDFRKAWAAVSAPVPLATRFRPSILKQQLAFPLHLMSPKRNLKIEERGDFFRKKTVPMIRLKGKWLRSAGFEPGQRLTLSIISYGVIELRLAD